MFDARRATGWVSVIYFVSLIVLGMMIIMTLFLAILLSNFGGQDEIDAEEEGNKGDDQDDKGDNDKGESKSTEEEGNKRNRSDGEMGIEGNSEKVGRAGAPRGNERTTKNIVDEIDYSHGVGDSGDGGGVGGFDDNALRKGFAAKIENGFRQAGARLARYLISGIRSVQVPDNLDQGRTLLIFGPKNPFRRGCAAMVANPAFDRVVLILIAISSISLALDNPLLDPDSALANSLSEIEVVTTILFTVEMALKVCAHGFFFMPGSYLRNSWNVLDFIVVVISVFQLFTDSSGSLQGLKSLRALRALRPLRYMFWFPRVRKYGEGGSGIQF